MEEQEGSAKGGSTGEEAMEEDMISRTWI